MKKVWEVSTIGIPWMDMSPDGNLSAVIDEGKGILYLVKPNRNTSFDLRRDDEIKPVVSGIVVLDGKAYVAGSYEKFAGVRIYSWSGFVSEVKHGWSGSIGEEIIRSPSGNHMCYRADNKLFCDGKEILLDYSIISVSDSGLVVLSKDDKSVILKDGRKLFDLNTSKVISYRELILASEDGKLKIYSSNEEILMEKEGYTFDQTTLLRWTLLPTEKYIFWHEALGNTHILNWNLSEVGELPGFPYFANENFVVTGDND